jgi:hypothetical protein
MLAPDTGSVATTVAAVGALIPQPMNAPTYSRFSVSLVIEPVCGVSLIGVVVAWS